MIKRLKYFHAVLFLIGILLGYSRVILAQSIDPTLPTQPDSNSLGMQDGDSELSDENVKEGLQLNAIYFHLKNPMVIINGKVIGLNEKIGSYKVIAIERQSVKLLSSKGENLVLALDNLEVKKFHRESTGNKT